jgi:hypothetical protein
LLHFWHLFLICHIASSQVPARFKHLNEKHKAIFAADIDITAKNLALGLKRMQSQRMSALLNDVDVALKHSTGPSVTLHEAFDGEEENNNKEEGDDGQDDAEGGDVEDENDDAGFEVDHVVDEEVIAQSEENIDVTTDFEVVSRTKPTDVPQAAVIVDASCTTVAGTGDEMPIDSPPHSPAATHSAIAAKSPIAHDSPVASNCTRSEAYLNAPDAPGFDLFPEGSLEWHHFNQVPEKHSAVAPNVPALSMQKCLV